LSGGRAAGREVQSRLPIEFIPARFCAASGAHRTMLTARDIMTEDVSTIRPSCTIQEAIELLLSRDISGLPVVDERGRLVGIVTEFALLAVAYDERVMQDAVAQHMTTDLLTVEASDPVRKVADLCVVHRVRRVPVMEDGKLVGLISRCDVLRAIYQSKHAPAAATA
jgi:CBS domain-containing protein